MQTLEIIGALVGLIYLYLEYKANKWLWLFGVIMPIIYIVVFYRSKFYADMGVNIYYLFASMYGWIAWTKGSRRRTKAGIRHTPAKQALILFFTAAGLFMFIAFILFRYTDSPVPFGDSFTTTLSIVGMWMLAHKYIEQWGIWFVVNVVSSSLYFHKNLFYTGILFAVYALISIFGYFKWKKMMDNQSQAILNCLSLKKVDS